MQNPQWHIGQTEQTVAGWRVYRGALSIRLTQLANAGKRGKRVPVLTLWAKVDRVIDTLANTVLVVVQTDGADVAALTAQLARMAAVAGVELEVSEVRGVDVAPDTAAAIELRGQGVALTATLSEFSIRDITDTDNEQTLIQRTPTAARRFYVWAQANTELLRTGSFSAVWSALRTIGIDAHCFCAVD